MRSRFLWRCLLTSLNRLWKMVWTSGTSARGDGVSLLYIPGLEANLRVRVDRVWEDLEGCGKDVEFPVLRIGSWSWI